MVVASRFCHRAGGRNHNHGKALAYTPARATRRRAARTRRRPRRAARARSAAGRRAPRVGRPLCWPPARSRRAPRRTRRARHTWGRTQHRVTLHRIALRCATFRCMTLHFITFICVALRFGCVSVRCVTPHHRASHRASRSRRVTDANMRLRVHAMKKAATALRRAQGENARARATPLTPCSLTCLPPTVRRIRRTIRGRPREKGEHTPTHTLHGTARGRPRRVPSLNEHSPPVPYSGAKGN